MMQANRDVLFNNRLLQCCSAKEGTMPGCILCAAALQDNKLAARVVAERHVLTFKADQTKAIGKCSSA